MVEEAYQRKVLLIGWDASDWEHITPLLEEGLMPTLDAFINRGVMGNLATLQPILSPMLWNSVATGKSADKHGIHGFIEPDPVNGGARPYTSTSRKCKALWNILTQRGLQSNIVGWWASHPA
jgi:predicted AlkP superfamily phosphohydrolase/phosphomutase